jgi:hypothetical protein
MRKGLLILMLLAGVVQADETLMCGQYGYTDKSENFHRMNLLPLISIFEVSKDEVKFGNEVFKKSDPKLVDMDGLATTYVQPDSNKLLYVYKNEQGKQEIGISLIKEDTDDLFADKSVFTDCETKATVREEVVASKASLRRKVDPSQPLFTF